MPLQFGEWRPDLALLDSQWAAIADNVFPGSNSYKPIPSLLPFTAAALPTGPAVGLTAARRADGSWAIYAGSRTRLYRFSLAGWTDVTRTTGGDYHVPVGQAWSATQFGSNLVICQTGDPVQTIDVDSGTNFAALGGSPPAARNCKQIGDFLVLGGLVGSPRKIAWSGLNNITQWTIGLNLSDVQEFPDNPVQGVAGSEVGYVVCDRSIYVMQFLPGDITYIFNFSRVVKDRGAVSEFGFGTVADTLYFLAEDGFYSLTGSNLAAIGQDKCNEFFLANSDVDRRNVVRFVPSNKPFVVWAFHSTSAAQTYDRVMIYNWSNQRWATGTIAAQIYAQLGSVGLDLDTTGTETGDALLDSTAKGLDSFAYIGGRPLICGIDPNGLLCALQGPNLSATVETAEAHLVPGARAFISEVYPLIDGGATSIVASATRERLEDTPVWGSPLPLEITGSIPLFSSSRLHRFRMTVPAGETWTNAQGVMVEAQQDGTVA